MLNVLARVLFILKLGIGTCNSTQVRGMVKIGVIFGHTSCTMFLFTRMTLGPQNGRLSSAIIITSNDSTLLCNIRGYYIVDARLLFILRFDRGSRMRIYTLQVTVQRVDYGSYIQGLVTGLAGLAIGADRV